MKKLKSSKDIKDELLQSFLELEASFLQEFDSDSKIDRIAYIELEFCEFLLNSIKSLEYRYRDDVPEMRSKKNWNLSLKRAISLIEKYGENTTTSSYSDLKLKSEFDSSGYLENRDFLKRES